MAEAPVFQVVVNGEVAYSTTDHVTAVSLRHDGTEKGRALIKYGDSGVDIVVETDNGRNGHSERDAWEHRRRGSLITNDADQSGEETVEEAPVVEQPTLGLNL